MHTKIYFVFLRINTMKSLIIHPADESTDFLRSVYAHLENATLITGTLNNKQISEALQKAERTILLGHGLVSGLLSANQFYEDRLTVVDDEHAPLLKGKPNSIYIWCNADVFVRRNKLSGFHSGMFISEMTEAQYLSVDTTEEQINFSNTLFAEIVGKNIHLSALELLHEVQKHYGAFRDINPVIDYNIQRLYAC